MDITQPILAKVPTEPCIVNAGAAKGVAKDSLDERERHRHRHRERHRERHPWAFRKSLKQLSFFLSFFLLHPQPRAKDVNERFPRTDRHDPSRLAE
jgi:hypothetical protein